MDIDCDIGDSSCGSGVQLHLMDQLICVWPCATVSAAGGNRGHNVLQGCAAGGHVLVCVLVCVWLFLSGAWTEPCVGGRFGALVLVCSCQGAAEKARFS